MPPLQHNWQRRKQSAQQYRYTKHWKINTALVEFCEIRLPRYCGRFSTPFRWYYYTYTIYLLPWNIAVFPIYYAVSNTNDRNYYKHYNPPKLAELCDRCGLSIVSFVLSFYELTNALTDVDQTRQAWARGDPQKRLIFGVDPDLDHLDQFLSRVSTLTCDIDIAILSVRLPVRLSVRPLRSGIV